MENPEFKKFQRPKDSSKSNTPEKKLESVVSGVAKVKKKSEVRKFADIFLAEDIANVKNYIFSDVLIPTIKKAISDIVTNGVDMVLYGETERTKRGSASKIQYGSMFKSSDRREPVSRNRGIADYDDIIFDSRGAAETVLSVMDEAVDKYGVVSVGDMYDLAGITTTNYTVNKYGWSDLSTAQVVRVRDGFMIKLPRALPLN